MDRRRLSQKTVFVSCYILAIAATGALAATKANKIDQANLPAQRPQPFTFRGYADTLSYGVNYTRNSALDVTVQHKPIPGAHAAAGCPSCRSSTMHTKVADACLVACPQV
jgi:hypothetical protein